jgi:hypothetical protein
VTFVDVVLIVLAPAAAIIAAVLFGFIVPALRRRRRLRGPISITVGLDADVLPPRPERPLSTPRPMTPVGMDAVAPQGYAPAPQYASPPQYAPRSPPPNPVQRPHYATATGTDGGLQAEARGSTAETPHLRLATSPDPAVRGVRRKERPLDGTLQFLPGRLEVVDGRDVGQEVRFVRQPGQETTVVTFGRNEGEQYRHVQLHEPTVSRVHARMTLEGRRWRLTNMSKTNPVVVNGEALEGEEASHVLTEGDRVEMGEVVFKFRSK